MSERVTISFLQVKYYCDLLCFDILGRVTGKASGMYKSTPVIRKAPGPT